MRFCMGELFSTTAGNIPRMSVTQIEVVGEEKQRI